MGANAGYPESQSFLKVLNITTVVNTTTQRESILVIFNPSDRRRMRLAVDLRAPFSSYQFSTSSMRLPQVSSKTPTLPAPDCVGFMFKTQKNNVAGIRFPVQIA
jgi:hypothetical protein